MTAIGDMGLTSVNIGDYLVILNKNIDVTVDEEPYISFTLFYHTMSGRFFMRIWNKTVATGTTSDLSTLVKVCKAYFKRGKPCLALIKEGSQNEMPQNVTSACHSFLSKNHGSVVEMCTECKKTRDTITNETMVADDIKTEDSEEINGDGQCDDFPSEEAFDDAVCKDAAMEVGDSDDKISLLRERQENTNQITLNKDFQERCARPKLSCIELIAEALEGGKTLNIEEITQSISAKHPSFNASDASWKLSIRTSIGRTSRFERVDEAGGIGRKGGMGFWRLNTSNDASDQCDYCDMRFPEGRKSRKYKYHMQYSHGWNTYQCSSCDFVAMVPDDIVAHMEERGHKDSTVACPVCSDSVDKTEIAAHSISCIRQKQSEKQKRHREREKDKLVHDPCPTCGKIFKQKRVYANHLRMHLRQQGVHEPVTVKYSREAIQRTKFWLE